MAIGQIRTIERLLEALSKGTAVNLRPHESAKLSDYISHLEEFVAGIEDLVEEGVLPQNDEIDTVLAELGEEREK